MEIIIVLFILFLVFKKMGINFSDMTNTMSILTKALKNQQFSNIKTLSNSNNLSLITADSHGENYLFALKLNSISFGATEIDTIYDKATKFHIHNVVIINKDAILPTSPLGKKIASYEFELWNYAKLISLARNSNNSSSTYTKSVLRTSNTSYDKCKIDNNPVDPIQSGSSKSHSLLGNLFQKPNRL